MNVKIISCLAISMIATVGFSQVFTTDSVVSASQKVKTEGQRITAALFVEDSTVDGVYASYLPSLGNKIAAALNKRGFGVVRPEDALGLSENINSANANRTKLLQTVERGGALDLDSANLFQIARDLGSDCYIKCSLTGCETEELGDTGIFDVAVSLSVSMHGSARGDGAYGDTVVVNYRATSEQLAKNNKSFFAKSLTKASDSIAKSFSEGIKKLDIRAGRIAKVHFNCAIEADSVGVALEGVEKWDDQYIYKVNGTVLVDGFAMGTTDNEIELESGIHVVRIYYPHCEPYVVRARFVDGQSYNVILKLSDSGKERYKNTKEYLLNYVKANNEVEDINRQAITSDRITNMVANTADYILRLNSEASVKLADKSIEAEVELLKTNSERYYDVWALEIKENAAVAGKQSFNDAELKRMYVEAHTYAIKTIAKGEGRKRGNSYNREEYTERHTSALIKSEGDGVKSVDSNTDETRININEETKSDEKADKDKDFDK